MAKATELLQSGGKAVDVVVIGATSYYKEGIVGKAGSLDHGIASQRIGTHADDAALTVGTDAVVAIAGLADETASDSVDEGDVGALRMTLNRRLITADQKLDDAAFGVATDYVSAMGAMADETSPDSVDEGDLGVLRMTLDRHLLVKEKRSATGTVTSQTDQATSVTLLASNASRLGAVIYNDSDVALYVKCGATASATSFTYKVAAAGTVELPYGYTGIVDGIWASDSTGSARITEFT